MRKTTKWEIHQNERRQIFLEHGFALFSTRSIEAVAMPDVAKASGHGIATLYRYYNNKAGFAVAIAEWKWGEFFKENRKRRPSADFAGMTAAQMYSFYLDSFLQLYRNNKALLRFNQLFNVYLQSEPVEGGTVDAYRALLKPVTEFFHLMYERAKEDGTVRTDVPEEEMLSLTVHLMLAAVTRYAVGLVYQPPGGFDELEELEALKEMLYLRYTK